MQMLNQKQRQIIWCIFCQKDFSTCLVSLNIVRSGACMHCRTWKKKKKLHRVVIHGEKFEDHYRVLRSLEQLSIPSSWRHQIFILYSGQTWREALEWRLNHRLQPWNVRALTTLLLKSFYTTVRNNTFLRTIWNYADKHTAEFTKRNVI